MEIIFKKLGRGEYQGKVNDYTFTITANMKSWQIGEIGFKKLVECNDAWRCKKHDVDLDTLLDDYPIREEDKLCLECPREVIDSEETNRMIIGPWLKRKVKSTDFHSLKRIQFLVLNEFHEELAIRGKEAYSKELITLIKSIWIEQN